MLSLKAGFLSFQGWIMFQYIYALICTYTHIGFSLFIIDVFGHSGTLECVTVLFEGKSRWEANCRPGSCLACSTLLLMFGAVSILLSIVAVLTYIPTNSVPFSPRLPFICLWCQRLILKSCTCRVGNLTMGLHSQPFSYLFDNSPLKMSHTSLYFLSAFPSN